MLSRQCSTHTHHGTLQTVQNTHTPRHSLDSAVHTRTTALSRQCSTHTHHGIRQTVQYTHTPRHSLDCAVHTRTPRALSRQCSTHTHHGTLQTVKYTHAPRHSLDSAEHTPLHSLGCAVHTHHGQICCHNTDYVHVNGHYRTITVTSAKQCIKLPDDGSLVIRNMLEQFLNIL